MRTIVDEKIEINGRKIHYKVLSPAASVENRPFMLCVQGGPGFSSLSVEMAMASVAEYAKNTNADMPNLIFYDPVGCGSSDKAEDIAAEYTMENYTEQAARVVEAVKAKLIPNQAMDLRAVGGSFGSMTVMDLPVYRPNWLDENSDIRLRLITSIVGPNGADKEYALRYLDTNFADHPEYQSMRTALGKLLDGKIIDHDDYLRFVFNLAPLYSDEMAKMKNGFVGKLLMKYPHAIISTLKFVNKIVRSEKIAMMIEGMTGCSLDVINHFFGSDFGGFNLTQQIANNKELYSKVPICLISSARDHMVDAGTALDINKLLPDSSAAIIFNDKHQIRSGPNKDLFDQIRNGIVCDGRIPDSALAQPAIVTNTVTADFQRQLAALVRPMRKHGSTVRAMSVLGVQGGDVEQVVMPRHEIKMNDVIVQPDVHPAYDVEAVSFTPKLI